MDSENVQFFPVPMLWLAVILAALVIPVMGLGYGAQLSPFTDWYRGGMIVLLKHERQSRRDDRASV